MPYLLVPVYLMLNLCVVDFSITLYGPRSALDNDAPSGGK